MSNIISAIINLVENPKIELIRKGSSHNRANNMGEALEEYIKDWEEFNKVVTGIIGGQDIE